MVEFARPGADWLAYGARTRSGAPLGQDGQHLHRREKVGDDRAGLAGGARTPTPGETLPQLLGEQQDFEEADPLRGTPTRAAAAVRTCATTAIASTRAASSCNAVSSVWLVSTDDERTSSLSSR